MNKNISEAIALIDNQHASFVVIRDNEIIHKDSGIGVSCIMRLIDENPKMLEGAIVVDKVIGEAAAILLIKYRVKMVYGLVMSETAKGVLKRYQVEFDCRDYCEFILNRDNSGLCPLEDSVKEIDDIDQAIIAIRQTIAYLMLSKEK